MKKHPKGLMVLFFTEMWERFGFYLMLGIFTLYMIDKDTGGMGMDKASAAEIYGTYIALVYFTPFIGGLLADRFLGYRLSITIGGLLMGTGYIMLAIPGMTMFYIALGVIIIGNGFFKPNISTLLGRLYEDRPELKDTGYNIFYMGINIGAFVCNFVAAILRNKFGWGYAFAAAGIGMYIGLIIFWIWQKNVKEADIKPDPRQGEGTLKTVFLIIILPAAACATLGYFLFYKAFGWFDKPTTAMFVGAVFPVIGYYVSIWYKAPRVEKRPIAALLVIFGVVIIFWMIFHQNGSALTYWAKENTRREVSGTAARVLDGMQMAQKVKGDNKYYANVLPKDRPKPGETRTLVPAELFQSINPFFVVALSPLVLWFFGFLRRRNKEPTTPGKIGWGMIITALSTLLMIAAVQVTHDGAIKGSAGWLISTYGVITIGELCLSPMGLSLVSKLSPKHLTGLMMGGWFLSTAFGNKLSGVLSGLWEKINHTTFFIINCASAVFAAILIFLLLPWLRKVMGEGRDKE